MLKKDPFSTRIYGDWTYNTFGYGDRKGAWSKYYVGAGAAQNLNLELLMKELGLEDYSEYPSLHWNLCGWLVAMEGVGVSLEEGFWRLAALYPDQLKDPHAQANSPEIVQFIEAFSDYGWSAESKRGSKDLEASLLQGHRAMALIALDENNRFSTGEENAKKGHWIRIRSIDDDNVTYYDSLSNEERTISRIAFDHAWASAQYVPGNTSRSNSLFVDAYIE